MGSSGSGSFSDYSGKLRTDSGDGPSGGSSGYDKCREAFTARLEDVASHQYYFTHGSLPPVGSQISIALIGRIVATSGNIALGSLPTSFNYLARCLANGITYTGIITASHDGKNPQIHADFVAN